MLTIEKRRNQRVPFLQRVDYYCWDKLKSADACELSPEGIFLRTSDLLPEGTMLTLRLRLPGYSRAFTVLGRVEHVALGGPTRHSGMGILFVDIAAGDQDRVRDYVARRPCLAA